MSSILIPYHTQSDLVETTEPKDALIAYPGASDTEDSQDSGDSGDWVALIEHSSDDDTDNDSRPFLPALFPNPNRSARHAAPLDSMQAVLRELTSHSMESDSPQSDIEESSEDDTGNASIPISPASFCYARFITRYTDTLEEFKSDLSDLPRPSNESELPRFEYYLHLLLPTLPEVEPDKHMDRLALSKAYAILIRGCISGQLAEKYSWPADLDALLECIHSRSPPAQYPSGDFESTLFPRRTKTEDLDDYLYRVRLWCMAYFTRINSNPAAVQSLAQQMWFSHCSIYPEIVDSMDFATAVNKFHTLIDVFIWFSSQPKLRPSLVRASSNTSQHSRRSDDNSGSHGESEGSNSNRRNGQVKVNNGNSNGGTKATKQNRTSKAKGVNKRKNKRSKKTKSLQKNTETKGGNEKPTFQFSANDLQRVCKAGLQSERHFVGSLTLSTPGTTSDWLYTTVGSVCCTPHLSDLQHPVPVKDCIIETYAKEEIRATHAGYATFTFPSVTSNPEKLTILARVLYAPGIAYRVFSAGAVTVDNHMLPKLGQHDGWYVTGQNRFEPTHRVAKMVSLVPYVDSEFVNCFKVDLSGLTAAQR